MSDYQTIRYQRDGDVGTLTLARPGKRNAQNPLMWQELARLGAELGPDETLRCLVVTGEGPNVQPHRPSRGPAGMLAGLAQRPDDERSRTAGRAAAGTFSWIPDLGCASIAAVRGHAYGAGLQLALACDFRIFAEGTKVACSRPATASCPTWAPPSAAADHRREPARELILLGDIIDAEEACGSDWPTGCPRRGSRRGRGRAGRAAGRPAAAGGAQSQAGHRRGLYRSPEESLNVALEEQLRCLRSEDFKEAGLALAEGRNPQWQGR